MRTKMSTSYLSKIIWLLGSEKKKLPVLLFCVLLASLLDVLGIGAVGPLAVATLKDTGIEVPPISLPFFNLNLDSFTPASIGLFILAVFAIKVFVGLFINYYVLRFCWYHKAGLRRKLMHHYMGSDYEELKKKNSSDYIYNMLAAVNQYLQSAMLPLLRVFSEGIVFVSVVALLLVMYGKIFSVFVGFVVFAALIYDRIFRKKNTRFGKLANDHAIRALTYMREGINSFRSAKIFGIEDHFVKSVYHHSLEDSKCKLWSQFLSSSIKYLFELVLVIFIASVVVFSGFMQNPAALTPALAAIGVATIRLLPMVSIVLRSFVSIRFGKDSTNRLYNELSAKNKQLNFVVPDQNLLRPSKEKLSLINCQHKPLIEFKSVSFSHDKHVALFSDINLCINKGDIIGVVGVSGAGKSTLIDMMLGFLKPDSGEVLIGGQPISDCLVEWRSIVAYLPQHTFLRDASVVENIAFGLPNDQIQKDQVEKVAKAAMLGKVIDKMKLGLDSPLGEGGVNLSGGQKQRIALARALYFDREVLVLDEATSALDGSTETEIVSTLKGLGSSKTIIIIAHSREILEVCDKIIEIKAGKASLQDKRDAQELPRASKV